MDVHDPLSAPTQTKPQRLDSIDLLRGVVMVIMALDHVRDFFSEGLLKDPTAMNTETPGIFPTRWITHFCAPTFIFLAGTGAFLSGTRGKTKPELSWFLFTRGLWLAFFEVVINRMLWMFNYDLHHHGAGVFWAIGWSMVVLSVLVYLPVSIVTAFGVAMIVLHNLLDRFTAQDVHLPGWLWVVLHRPGGETVVGSITFETGYCLIPWMGVMAAGYGFGSLYLLDRAVRRRWLFFLGIALIGLFIILRIPNRDYTDWPAPVAKTGDMQPAPNGYGDAHEWRKESNLLWTTYSFLNCTKYPPSLLYLLMTLGPAILFLAIFDRPLGPLAQPIITFGRVPLFFYFLHIPLIHGGAVLLDYARFGWSPLTTSGPWFKSDEIPQSYGVSLPMVYLIWIGVILILYLPCRWFAELKHQRRDAWLSYF